MPHLTLVLDNLRSCHNVGSIIRTANGFNHYDFIFLGITPYPCLENDRRLKYRAKQQTAQISKTSLGAEKEIRGKYFQEAAEFLQHKNDSQLICLEQSRHSRNLGDFRRAENCYLVVGNEITGISAQLMKKAQTHLMIPMLGSKESFNVAVATGIALYHFSLFE